MIDLVITAVLSVALVPLVIYTDGAARVILGLIFLLFSPGYSLISALFPDKYSISAIERLALSFGLSFAMVSLTGLALNYTPFGIRLYPILISQLVLIGILLLLAWWRRSRIAPETRFGINIKQKTVDFSKFWKNETGFGKILNVVLVISVVAAIGTLIYTAANPKPGEKFTEFYILGANGIADDYPEEIVLGESAWVTVGIVNREHDNATNNVEALIQGTPSAALGPVTLAHGEEYESRITFKPNATGSNQKVEFHLYKDGSDESYLSLHIWVNVTKPDQ